MFSVKEDSCGKAGRANLLQPLHLCEDTNWPELESLYRLSGNVYDFRTNSNVSLEDWTNVEAEIDDREFALVSELHRYWEMLSEPQVPEIHYFTCFLLWIIPHLLHKALYFKMTPLTLPRS